MTKARIHAAISDAPLSVADAHAFVVDPRAGATVVFTGTVRDHNEGRSVTGLTYEAYREHAERQLRQVAERVVATWPAVCAVWMVHRVGKLTVTDLAVTVATSSPHRGPAFEAAAWGIETLKAEVAIWKQEHWASGGSHWPGVD